jgi:hypothetical protein
MLVENQKLNIIDYIFLRTRMDLEMFYKYIGKDRVFYLPDLSILLTKNITKQKVTFTDDVDSSLSINNVKNKKIATICLSRNIYNEKYSLEYYNVVYNISKFVEYLIDSDYHIIFLPSRVAMSTELVPELAVLTDLVLILEDVKTETSAMAGLKSANAISEEV